MPRPQHCIVPYTKTELPSSIIYLDTETYPEKLNSTEFLHKFRLGWTCWRYDDKEEWKFWNKSQIHNLNEYILNSIVSAKNKKTWIIAHNMSFDFQAAQLYRILKHERVFTEKLIANGGRLIISGHAISPPPNSKLCEFAFISSTNFYMTSIAELGKMVGLPKLDIKWDNTDDEKVKEYCKRDVEILKLSMENLFNFLKSNDLGSFKPTIAGLAFNAFKHKFLPEKPIMIHNNDNVIALERKSYRGGITDCFQLNDIPPPIYQLDVCSMYPFVMRNMLFPTRLIKYTTDPTVEHFHTISSSVKHPLIIMRCKIKTKKRTIAIRQDMKELFCDSRPRNEKLIMPIGEFEATITTPEIELLKDCGGEIIQIYEAAIYESAQIFKNYVDFFFDLKKKFTDENNKIMSNIAKLFLNSLYGKFGQKNPKFEPIASCPKEKIEIEEYIDADSDDYVYLMKYGGKIWKKTGEEEAFDSFTAIASFCTAYARCYLIKLINIAGKENCFYCDTDSIFCNETGLNNLNNAKMIGNELGKLKLENVWKKLKIYCPKQYEGITLNDKAISKLKGIPKKAIKLNTTEPKWLTQHFMSFTSNMRIASRKNNLLDGVLFREIEKELTQKYDKGLIDTETNRTIPYTLPDFQIEKQQEQTMRLWQKAQAATQPISREALTAAKRYAQSRKLKTNKKMLRMIASIIDNNEDPDLYDWSQGFDWDNIQNL